MESYMDVDKLQLVVLPPVQLTAHCHCLTSAFALVQEVRQFSGLPILGHHAARYRFMITCPMASKEAEFLLELSD